MLSLSVDNTGEGRYFLFNKYFDPTVRMSDIRKASRHCCMPAVNTSSVPTSVTVVLLRIHWFVADEARCAFGWGRTVPRLQRWELPGAEASTSWLPRRGSSDLQPHTLHCLVCMRCAPVCEVDCDKRMARLSRCVGEAVVKLFVGVSLDGGDLFLLSGL